jgi:hypothetical protein
VSAAPEAAVVAASVAAEEAVAAAEPASEAVAEAAVVAAEPAVEVEAWPLTAATARAAMTRTWNTFMVWIGGLVGRWGGLARSEVKVTMSSGRRVPVPIVLTWRDHGPILRRAAWRATDCFGSLCQVLLASLED